MNIPLPPDILFVAIQSSDGSDSYLDIIKALVTSGCDPQKPGSDGETPLQVAIIQEKVDVVGYSQRQHWRRRMSTVG